MSSSKKIAVILSGCGVFDGAEIHEAIMTLYAIMKHGALYEIFAPDQDQYHVINHITGEEMNETRNVLVESARIARGTIKPLSEFNYTNFDGLILPGGFGAAKNLSSFAFDGTKLNINQELSAAILSMNKAGKPLGALCIAPVIMAKIFKGASLTIGQDADTAKAVETLGATHQSTNHGEIVIDNKYKLVTTPCYMLDADILQIAEGADRVVKAMLQLM